MSHTFFMMYFLVNGCIMCTYGIPLVPSGSMQQTTTPLDYEEIANSTPNCELQHLGMDDVLLLDKGKVFIKAYNVTMSAPNSEITIGDITICFNRSMELKQEILQNCEKWEINEYEYSLLGNGSVVMDDAVLEPGSYLFKNGELFACATDYEDYLDYNNSTPNGKVSVTAISSYIGRIGGGISIVALTMHIVIFCLVPSLRNFPGYNLVSLSVAFILGYAFLIIGQIPEVLGLSCIISSVFQQYFFLVAFFCMNAMSFDVWRTLRLATTKLMMNSNSSKRRQFVCYCVYSWGSPAIITIISIILDNSSDVPQWIRPRYAKGDECWITNNMAKVVFFIGPAFTLLAFNGIFFVLSAFIIKSNTMKSTNDEEAKTARLNFFLYIRLALMMGITWMIGVVAIALPVGNIVWRIFDVLNSLQGLFLFLLFSCSRKVFNYLKGNVLGHSSKNTTSDKPSTISSSQSNATAAATSKSNRVSKFSLADQQTSVKSRH